MLWQRLQVLKTMLLAEDEITKILAKNQEMLNLSDNQRNRWHKRCLCLVEFKDVKQTPLEFKHQKNMDDCYN